jgi:ATP-binding cassette, subfamily B, bacterial
VRPSSPLHWLAWLSACAAVATLYGFVAAGALSVAAALPGFGALALAVLARAWCVRAARRRAGKADRRYGDFALYLRILREARPYWPHIGGILLVGLVATPVALLTPVPLKIAVDSVIGDDPLPGFLAAILPGDGSRDGAVLVLAVAMVVLVALLRQLQELASTLLRTYTGERLVLDFRARLFAHVQRLSIAFHDRRGIGDSTYRIQYDAQATQTIAVDGVIPFVTAGITLAAMLYVTAAIDAVLALVALAVVPVLFVALWAYRTRLRRRSREVKQLESSALGVVQEVLGAVRVVKAFAQEEREHGRFVDRSSRGMRARVRLALVEGVFGLLVGTTIAAGTALILYVGVRHVQAGTLTLGSLLLIMGYLTQLYEPLRTMSKKAASLQAAFASAERAFSLLDEAPDVVERPDARPLERAEGRVEFRDVSFGYEDERLVLEAVDFVVEPGTRVGIAGATGAGKTTLVSLLTRFYDPTAGTVLLDGVDLRDLRVADLRNQFAIVLQDPVLFSATIAENIAYARPHASFDEIVAAAAAANVHDFVAGLPDGYETQVGERGMRLSGGERQRISLARAFLKDAPILILDEPTSSVDMRTEAVIIEAMERLMDGRTSFMIAHRLSTLAGCDVRIEIANGEVVHGPRREATVHESVAVTIARALRRR